MNSLFGISLGSGERIIAAFNHLKKKCNGNSDTACIRTTLVINNEKSFKVVWKGKVGLNNTLCSSAKTVLYSFHSFYFSIYSFKTFHLFDDDV